jgi:uncharacterized protein (TIGR00369 family)
MQNVYYRDRENFQRKQPTMKTHKPAETEPIAEELKERLAERLHNSHVNKLFHFTIEDIGKKYCNLSLAYREAITNGQKSRGTIHGGIVAALIDTAAAFALSTLFDGQMSFATVDLHVNFLDRAQSKIYAHAHVIRAGSRLNVCDVDVVNDHGKLVAKATLNFILTKPMEKN